MGKASTFYRHKIGADGNPPLMLGFRDIIIEPGRTEFDVTKVKYDMSAKIGPYTLKYPALSSAMDTVTEEEMAVKMALYGGAGVVHRNFGKSGNSPEVNEKIQFEAQLKIAKKIKRTRSNMVMDVTKVKPDDTIQYARTIMENLGISGLVVVDDNDCFKGILTKRDVRVPKCLESNYSIVSDAMTSKENVVWAREGISNEEAEKMMYLNGRIEKLPVLKESGEIAGLMTLKDMHTDYPDAALDEQGRLLCFMAVSHFKPKNSENFKLLKELDTYVDVLFTDVADFYKIPDIESAKWIMEELNNYWVVGNIGTYAAMEFLATKAEFPEDKWVGVKVGMGSGSTCITTLQTGFGSPTLYATACVADAMVDYGLKDKLALIADGGFEHPGDIPKAFVVGADLIMSGHYYAGTTESPGYIDTIGGRKMKVYRGMGSREARMAGNIGERYGINTEKVKEQVPEGISTYVPYVGDLSRVVSDHISALRQSMGYGGVLKISEFQKLMFGRSTPAGQYEAAPHV